MQIANPQFAIRNSCSLLKCAPLLSSGLIPRKLSPSALQSYLLFGSVSEPMTLVEGVLSLPPDIR